MPDIEAEAMALPEGVRIAAEAIEASRTFREHFTPAHPLGRLHPAAVEFARLAAGAITGLAHRGGRRDGT
jgi:hypothetical protein